MLSEGRAISNIFVYFSFYFHYSRKWNKKKMLWFMSKSVLHIFSSKSCVVSGLIFMSLIHLSFVYDISESERLSCSVMSYSLWPMECSLPVHGILQTRILEWLAISFPRRSSWPKGWSQVSCIAGGFFTIWATRESSNFILLHIAAQFSQRHLLKRPSFLHCTFLPPLS